MCVSQMTTRWRKITFSQIVFYKTLGGIFWSVLTLSSVFMCAYTFVV